MRGFISTTYLSRSVCVYEDVIDVDYNTNYIHYTMSCTKWMIMYMYVPPPGDLSSGLERVFGVRGLSSPLPLSLVLSACMTT